MKPYDTRGRDRPELPQTQISQAMIEAGVSSYLSWDHAEDDPKEIVKEIFAEMLVASSLFQRERPSSPESSSQ